MSFVSRPRRRCVGATVTSVIIRSGSRDAPPTLISWSHEEKVATGREAPATVVRGRANRKVTSSSRLCASQRLRFSSSRRPSRNAVLHASP